jgi:hypothetical protein
MLLPFIFLVWVAEQVGQHQDERVPVVKHDAQDKTQQIDYDDSNIPSVVSTPTSTPPASPKKSPCEDIEMMYAEASFQKLQQIINAYPFNNTYGSGLFLDDENDDTDDDEEEKEVVVDMASPQSTVVPDLPTQEQAQEPTKTVDHYNLTVHFP